MTFSPSDAISTFTSGAQPTAQVKQSVTGVDQTTGQRQQLILQRTVVQPITGQPNDTPVALPDPSTFDIDGYRYGDPSIASGEGLNPRTLSGDTSSSNDADQLASMTLRTTTDGNDLISAYSRFFLQSVSEVEQEKYQVVETFTGFYAFFFGKRPPVYRYSGLLISDPNYRWNNDFKFVYENFFRGTSAVSFGAEVLMIYDSRIITGFPLSLSMQQEAINPKGTPFAMDMLVIDHTPIDFSIDIDGLLQSKQQDLLKMKATLLASSLAGPGTAAADQATNGSTTPNSFSIAGQSIPNPISQFTG